MLLEFTVTSLNTGIENEKKLQSNYERFEEILDSINDYIYLIDSNWNFVYVSKYSAKDCGFEPSELIGKNIWSVMPQLLGTEVEKNYREVMNKRETKRFEWKTIYTDSIKEFAVFPSAEGITVYGKDITKRKKAEQELCQSKSDWEHTFDCVPDFIAILDNEFRIMRANRAMAQQLGVAPEKAIGLICYQCIHGLDNPPDFCPHTQTMKDGKEHTAEVNEPRLGGDFLVSTTPLKDEQGKVIGSVHVARNITQHKKAEEALRESEQRWATTLASIGDAVIATDKSGKITFMNDVAQDLTGWRLSDASQKPVKTVFNIVNEENRIEVENPIFRVLKRRHDCWFS